MKLLKTTTDGAVSQKSNEIHLKLNDCQLNRYFVDTSGLLATWPEFWAIGLSFLDTFAFSLDTLLAHSASPSPFAPEVDHRCLESPGVMPSFRNLRAHPCHYFLLWSGIMVMMFGIWMYFSKLWCDNSDTLIT